MTRCWLCNKKFEIVYLISSAVCWGVWKLKKLYVLSGCALEKYEVMASGASYGQMLECAAPAEAGEWIRRCSNIPGEKNVGATAAGVQAASWEYGCCT
jgi:hypothetical protein